MEDVISVLPFGGTFDLVQLKGSTLLQVFEHSVYRYGGSTGEFLQVSGKFLIRKFFLLSHIYCSAHPRTCLQSYIVKLQKTPLRVPP